MEAIAVIIPMSAIIPKAMIATVIPVRSLLLRMVRKASDKESLNLMQNRVKNSMDKMNREVTISAQFQITTPVVKPKQKNCFFAALLSLQKIKSKSFTGTATCYFSGQYQEALHPGLTLLM